MIKPKRERLVPRRSLPGRNLDEIFDALLSIFTCLFFVCLFFRSFCVCFYFSCHFCFFFLSCVVREHDQWGVTARWFPDEDLANDRLRYGVLGDVYSRGGPVDFLNAHVVQFLEGSQSVVGHFQW